MISDEPGFEHDFSDFPPSFRKRNFKSNQSSGHKF